MAEDADGLLPVPIVHQGVGAVAVDGGIESSAAAQRHRLVQRVAAGLSEGRTRSRGSLYAGDARKRENIAHNISAMLL